MARTFPYFLDIETVPAERDWNKLDERTANIYHKKFVAQINKLADDGDVEPYVTHYADNAALYAEFGKVVAIAVGIVASGGVLRIKTLAFEGPQAESRMLESLKKLIEKAPFLCAHNGKEFDFPFLQRKYMMHNIDLPDTLNTIGKKPWEVLHEDTLEIWKFGQFKHYASLDAIANAFGIESPKTDMDGSMVADIYYTPKPNDVLPFVHMEPILKRIGKYCGADIVALANVWARMRREPMFTPDKIVYVDETPLNSNTDGKESNS